MEHQTRWHQKESKRETRDEPTREQHHMTALWCFAMAKGDGATNVMSTLCDQASRSPHSSDKRILSILATGNA